jgi:hypothetical protein
MEVATRSTFTSLHFGTTNSCQLNTFEYKDWTGLLEDLVDTSDSVESMKDYVIPRSGSKEADLD